MKNIGPGELKKLINRKEVILVDVRNDNEIAKGMIEKALHVPLASIGAWLETQNADRHYIFYCHVGVRSGTASLLAEGHRFNNIYNLVGGVLAWHQAGYEFTQK